MWAQTASAVVLVSAAALAGAEDYPTWAQAQAVRQVVLSSPLLAMGQAERYSAGRAVAAELVKEDDSWFWEVKVLSGARVTEVDLTLGGKLIERERMSRSDALEYRFPRPRISAAQALAETAKWRQGFASGLELEMEDGRLKWEATIITRSGKVWEVDVDARTGLVAEVELSEEE